MFLKTLKISHENICVGVSFYKTRPENVSNRGSNTGVFL